MPNYQTVRPMADYAKFCEEISVIFLHLAPLGVQLEKVTINPQGRFVLTTTNAIDPGQLAHLGLE